MRLSYTTPALAAQLAAQLGQEADVPAGSAWYPGAALTICRELDAGRSLDEVRDEWRISLGITRAENS